MGECYLVSVILFVVYPAFFFFSLLEYLREVLDRSVTIPDTGSVTRSPTGSIRTIRSMTSYDSQQSGSGSGSGSRSTTFVPPSHTIPDLSDLESISGSSAKSTLTRGPSFASTHHGRATDDTAISSRGYLYPGDTRVIAPSRSSSLRRTTSLTDLDEEFASAMGRARARGGLGFGVGSTVLGDGTPVTMSSGTRLTSDVWIGSPPSSGRGVGTRTLESDDTFFSGGRSSSNGTRSYTLTSVTGTGTKYTTDTRTTTDARSSTNTRSSTDARTSSGRTDTGLVTDETALGFTSGGSNTQIAPSTLSYRRSDSASYLGDSADGYTSSGSALSRRREVRRSRASSRTYTSTEDSDKENSSGYTPTSRSATDTQWTLSTLQSCSYTESGSSTSFPPSSISSTRSANEESPSDYYQTASAGSLDEDYKTVKTPSASSYASLPTIPSDSEYTTAFAPSEYVTAELCKSEFSSERSTEYITAELCRSEFSSERSTEYITAELCKSDRESIAASEDMPHIPSEVGMEFDPARIPLPSSDHTPSEPSELSSTEGSVPMRTRSPSIWTTGDSRLLSIPESSSFPSTGDLSETPSSITESSVTVRRTASSISTPSVRESLWASETDVSYDSSMLLPSPSIISIPLPEPVDASFDTSFMRPTGSVMTSVSRFPPVTESSVSLDIPSSPSYTMSSTPSPSSISSSTESSELTKAPTARSPKEPSTEPSLLSVLASPSSPAAPTAPRSVSILIIGTKPVSKADV